MRARRVFVTRVLTKKKAAPTQVLSPLLKRPKELIMPRPIHSGMQISTQDNASVPTHTHHEKGAMVAECPPAHVKTREHTSTHHQGWRQRERLKQRCHQSPAGPTPSSENSSRHLRPALRDPDGTTHTNTLLKSNALLLQGTSPSHTCQTSKCNKQVDPSNNEGTQRRTVPPPTHAHVHKTQPAETQENVRDRG